MERHLQYPAMAASTPASKRLSGGLFGLLVGDALGVPYEFNPADKIPPRDQIEFEPPPNFRRSHQGIPPGTWSDDGAQALGLLASLVSTDSFDPRALAGHLINWREHGLHAVDGVVFDIGIQTSEAITRLMRGVPPLEAGGRADHSKGNGSLMRVLPLALWHRGSDAELVRDAHDQSRVTHGHPTVLACCALYCLWARRLLAGSQAAWSEAVEALREIYRPDPEMHEALEAHVRPDAERVARGSGFVVDSLFSAKWALEAGPYEAVVKAAISLGQDTDTTACIAGGLAGVRDGIDAIPGRWLDRLRGEEDVRWLHEALLARHA